MKEEYRGWTIFLVGVAAIMLLQLYLKQRPHPLQGQPAPAFAANNLDGESVAMASHIGEEVVLLDFWAIWCPPCRVSLPEVASIAVDYAERGIAVYAVNLGDSPEHISGFLEEMGIAPPVLLDPLGAAAEDYGVSGIPHLVIIDRDGIVDTVHIGAGRGLGESIRARLDVLLEDGAGDAHN